MNTQLCMSIDVIEEIYASNTSQLYKVRGMESGDYL